MRKTLDGTDLVKEYAKLGVLLQVNIASIFGCYGRGVRQLAEDFIKQELVIITMNMVRINN